MNRRKPNTFSTHLVKYHILFDQRKRRTSGWIFQALQGRWWTSFWITAVASGHGLNIAKLLYAATYGYRQP
jgi:hypothetical protein